MGFKLTVCLRLMTLLLLLGLTFLVLVNPIFRSYPHHSVAQERLLQIARNQLFQVKSDTKERHIFKPAMNKASIARQYDLMPLQCSPDQPVFAVIIVFARPTGFNLRQTIRQTWGRLANPVCGVRLLFMMGKVHDPQVNTRLQRESNLNGDILQSNQFDDLYRSAALKALHLLQWGSTFCSKATYIVKVDDDNWLNLPKYIQFLKTNKETDFVFGAILGPGTSIPRLPGGKYYVPREEYDQDLYPEYLSGILYAFPTRHVGRVLEASRDIPVTFNDDVYVCGLLTTAANLTRQPVPAYAWGHGIDDTACPKCDKMCIHYSNTADFRRLWNDPCCSYEELC